MRNVSNHSTPRVKSGRGVSFLATLVLVVLAIVVILLGLDVIHFEPQGWWT